MSRWALVDTNLLVLLIIGCANPALIAVHKRTSAYSIDDFHSLDELVRLFDGLATVPHAMAEASNLVRDINGPAERTIMLAFRALLADCWEPVIASRAAAVTPDFLYHGLTDAALLSVCGSAERAFALVTVDRPLARRAQALGCDVFSFLE